MDIAALQRLYSTSHHPLCIRVIRFLNLQHAIGIAHKYPNLRIEIGSVEIRSLDDLKPATPFPSNLFVAKVQVAAEKFEEAKKIELPQGWTVEVSENL